MCLLELDEKGTIEEEKDRLKAIREDNLTSAMYDIMKDKTERASEEWKRLSENRKKYKAENGCNTENEYLPSETIKNDLRGISDNERGITENGEEDAFEFFGNLIEQEKNEKITDDNIDDLEKLNGF